MPSHHAYIFEGSTSELPRIEKEAREVFGFTDASDPNVTARVYQQFGIEESRGLRASAALKSTSGRSLSIVAAVSMTTEAQQALLKLFEEPQQGSIFVLITPHGILLPTLRSRCLPFEISTTAKAVSSKEALTFLKSSYKGRVLIIAELLDEEDGVKERARDLLADVERELYGRLSQTTSKQEIIRGLQAIAKFRGYVSDRSASLKMILEHLAAALPSI
jgi:DNA polymerase III delta prime subunit